MENTLTENSFLTELNRENTGYLAKWLDYMGDNDDIEEAQKSAKIKTYRKGIKNFAEWLESAGIMNPERNNIYAYKNYLLDNYKATTAQTYFTGVKLFFKWLSYEGYYAENIAENTGSLKLSKTHKKDCLTAEQVKDLLAAVDRDTVEGKRDYAILCLMATTGLRVSAICDANRSDIVSIGGIMILKYKCKGYDDNGASVRLAGQVDAAIRDYLAARGKTKNAAPLFASESDRNMGGHLDASTVSRMVKRYLRAIGLDGERYSAHSLRHTAATLNLLNGGTLQETQQLLNHSNINTTMIYVHEIARVNSESENRIANAIFA